MDMLDYITTLKPRRHCPYADGPFLALAKQWYVNQLKNAH
jgi:hypothetical protein